jgi:hypothetical protein
LRNIASSDVPSRPRSQILWLFNDEVTEAGTMNLFFLWVNKQGKKELVTAPLDGTILPGVTRDSILTLAREWKVRCALHFEHFGGLSFFLLTPEFFASLLCLSVWHFVLAFARTCVDHCHHFRSPFSLTIFAHHFLVSVRRSLTSSSASLRFTR